MMIQRDFGNVQQTQDNTQIKNWQKIFTNSVQLTEWHSLDELDQALKIGFYTFNSTITGV